MDAFENKQPEVNSFTSNVEINDYLTESSKWGKFLAIVGFVGVGILILVAIFAGFIFSQTESRTGAFFPPAIFGFIYIIIAAIYFFPVNYLYKFSVQIKQGLNTNDITTITTGFRNLKSLFKFLGIFTLVILLIYGISLLLAIPALFLLRY